MGTTASVTIFMAYSQKDLSLRNELADHLANLRNQGVISDWYDGDIVAGTEWEPQILAHLDNSQIILLLVSSSFMASSFLYNIAIEHALARHKANQARVLPVILRPTDWQDAPFAGLSVLPDEEKAITLWENRDEAFLHVVKGIRGAIRDLLASSVSPLDEKKAISAASLQTEDAAHTDEGVPGVIPSPRPRPGALSQPGGVNTISGSISANEVHIQQIGEIHL